MVNSQKAPDLEGITSTIPADVDPFAYIANATISSLAWSSSEYTTGILITFLVFHAMIFAVCLFILTMSCISGAQQAQWLVRKLYIRDNSGQKVYETPLYFVNAAILTAFLQLVCSTATGAYIVILIKSYQLVTDQVLHAKGLPLLSTMFVFENLTHWALTHCFFVTAYLSRRFNIGMKKGVMRWISPPIFINLFFMGFPACTAMVVAGLSSWATFNLQRSTNEVMETLKGLKQGSFMWKQLHGGSNLSSEESSRISFELLKVLFALKKIFKEIGPHTQSLSHSFHMGSVIMLSIACTTCAVFISVFYLLIQTYSFHQRSKWALILPRVDHSANCPKQENISNPRRIKFMSTFPSKIRISMMNKQLLYLHVRALGVFLCIIFHCISLLVTLVKQDEVMKEQYWRNVATWVILSSGAWSAIPIVWQCWKLYTEQSTKEFPSFYKNLLANGKNDMEHSSRPGQILALELDIKLRETVHEIPAKPSVDFIGP